MPHGSRCLFFFNIIFRLWPSDEGLQRDLEPLSQGRWRGSWDAWALHFFGSFLTVLHIGPRWNFSLIVCQECLQNLMALVQRSRAKRWGLAELLVGRGACTLIPEGPEAPRYSQGKQHSTLGIFRPLCSHLIAWLHSKACDKPVFIHRI